MSKTAPVLVALCCSLLLTVEVAAKPAAPKGPLQASQAQLLAGLLSKLRITEVEVTQIYLDNPKPEVIEAFVAATNLALGRMQKRLWGDESCPDGSTHCDSCGCSMRGTTKLNPPDCLTRLPSFGGKTDAESMAWLHKTFATLEVDVLQRFVHYPRPDAVATIVDELTTVVKDTKKKLEKP